MKNFLLILFCVLSFSAFSQEVEQPVEENFDSKAQEKIEALKVAFITKELDLNADEAQKFWPVYNDFVDELKKAKVDAKDDVVAFEEKKVVILKKYQDNFKKVLGSEERVKKCFNAVPKFRRMLASEISKRRGQRPKAFGPGGGGKPPKGPGGPPPPPKRQ